MEIQIKIDFPTFPLVVSSDIYDDIKISMGNIAGARSTLIVITA